MCRKQDDEAKRERVRVLLCQPIWQQASDHAIKRHLNVGRTVIGRVRRELANRGEISLEPYRPGIGGHMPDARCRGGFHYGPDGSPVRNDSEE